MTDRTNDLCRRSTSGTRDASAPGHSQRMLMAHAVWPTTPSAVSGFTISRFALPCARSDHANSGQQKLPVQQLPGHKKGLGFPYQAVHCQQCRWRTAKVGASCCTLGRRTSIDGDVNGWMRKRLYSKLLLATIITGHAYLEDLTGQQEGELAGLAGLWGQTEHYYHYVSHCTCNLS